MSNENLNNDGNIEETKNEETKKEEIKKDFVVVRAVKKAGKFVKDHKPDPTTILFAGGTLLLEAVVVKMYGDFLKDWRSVVGIDNGNSDDEPIEVKLIEVNPIEPEVNEGSEE